MAKKNKAAKSKNKIFNSDPFVNLKGFAVFEPENKSSEQAVQKDPPVEIYGSFADEMEMLGVKQLPGSVAADESNDSLSAPVKKEPVETDEEIFLAAMGAFSVCFDESIPDETSLPPIAVPRRLKQMKRGKLTPDATLDLHGCLCAEVVGRLNHFLQNAEHNDWHTLLVITGKGLHSKDGEAVLRDEVERFLNAEGKQLIAEWGRAPKQFGGNGALVLFRRK
ncbi:MAG: Smr/MutS family protein [Desulfuromonadales bacterium]|nr:Smr/MutS family protein [Desulfuromonadales bacterium]